MGTFREGQRYYYYGMGDTTPQPRLAYRAGSVYIDAHNGILARLDAESGEVDWGYGYPTEAVQGRGYGRIILLQRDADPDLRPRHGAPAPRSWAGDAILIKGAKADRICVVRSRIG